MGWTSVENVIWSHVHVVMGLLSLLFLYHVLENILMQNIITPTPQGTRIPMEHGNSPHAIACECTYVKRASES